VNKRVKTDPLQNSGTGSRTFSGKIGTIFRSLRYRNYRLYFSGQSVSLIGTWMQRIAMPWLVYEMIGSALLLGIVGFAGQIPTFILGPFAGVLTDRWDRYKVLVASQILLMVQASVLAFLCLSGTIQVWQIVVLSIFMGCINAFDIPSRQSFVVDMVDKKEDLGNAIALNSMMFNGARIIGPSVAGIILASAGEGICFLINALSYIFVISSLLLMRITKEKSIRKKSEMTEELLEGLKYTFGFKPIKHLIILLAIVSLTGMSYTVLMPVFASEVLSGDSHTFGFLMGAAGIGALIGAVFLASRESVLKLGRIVPLAGILFGSGLILLSLTSYYPFSLLLMVFIGAGIMLLSASCNTILQTITEESMRGRVMSFYGMAVMGTAPFGSLLAGAFAKIIGTPETILGGGLISVIGALFFLRKLPELKNIVHPIYVKMGVIPEVASALQDVSKTQ